jgi:hypothetical protein
VSDRDELVKAIADGWSCAGHYNCGAMADDIAEAGRDLDAYKAQALREGAQTLRNVFRDETGNDWNWQDSATIPDSCASLLEAEADRLTAEPGPGAEALRRRL